MSHHIEVVELHPLGQSFDEDVCMPTPLQKPTGSAKRVWFREGSLHDEYPITPPSHSNRSGQFGSLFPNGLYQRDPRLPGDSFMLDGEANDGARGMTLGMLFMCATFVVCYSVNVLTVTPDVLDSETALVGSVVFNVSRDVRCADLADQAAELAQHEFSSPLVASSALSCFLGGIVLSDHLNVESVPPTEFNIQPNMRLALINTAKVHTMTATLEAILSQFRAAGTVQARFIQPIQD